jgi:hypothetical protein
VHHFPRQPLERGIVEAQAQIDGTRVRLDGVDVRPEQRHGQITAEQSNLAGGRLVVQDAAVDRRDLGVPTGFAQCRVRLTLPELLIGVRRSREPTGLAVRPFHDAWNEVGALNVRAADRQHPSRFSALALDKAQHGTGNREQPYTIPGNGWTKRIRGQLSGASRPPPLRRRRQE